MNSHFVIVILSLFVLFLGCVGQGPPNVPSPNNQNPTPNTGAQNNGTTAGANTGSNLKVAPAYDGSYIQGVFQRDGGGTTPEWVVFSYPDWVSFEKPGEFKEYSSTYGYSYLLDPSKSDTYGYYYLDTGTFTLQTVSITGESQSFSFQAQGNEGILLNGVSYVRRFAPTASPMVATGEGDESYGETDYDSDGYENYDNSFGNAWGSGYGDGGYGGTDASTGGSGSLNPSQAMASAGAAFPSPGVIVGAFVSNNGGWVVFDPFGKVLFGGWDGQPLSNGIASAPRTYQLYGNQITYYYTKNDGQVVSSTKPFQITNDGTNGQAAFIEDGTEYRRVDYPLTGLALSGKYYNYNVSQYGYPSAYGDSYSSTSTSKTYYTFSLNGSVVREGKGTFSSTSVNKDQYGTGENQDIYGNYYDEQTTTDGAAGGNTKSGTYSIQGNKLLIQYSDGSTESAVIAVPDLSQAQSGMLYLDDLPFVKAE